jgi:steroid delta-isomerase-like uncharacterized protein
MTPAENKKIAMRFYDEVVNAGDTAVIEELLADDYVDHQEVPGIPSTRDGVRQWFEMMRGAFPDLKMTVLRMVAEDDELWVHFRAMGTHKGEFMGMPPTDSKFDVEGFDRVRIKDGKAIEHWNVTDSMAMMEQLGLAPLPT